MFSTVSQWFKYTQYLSQNGSSESISITRWNALDRAAPRVIFVLLLLFTTWAALATHYCTYADLVDASLDIAIDTAEDVTQSSDGNLGVQIFENAWQNLATPPGSLARLTDKELQDAAEAYKNALPTTISDAKRDNARGAYLEFLKGKKRQDGGY